MNQFNSLDELRNFLRKDRDEGNLCPLRFINVDTMETWVAVKKLLLSMSHKYICLSSFCVDEDTTPNMHRFTASIRNTTESICVSPLSEFLRVKPDIAKSTVEDLIGKDYTGNFDGKLRIYIPMYRMKSVLQNITDSDPRKKDCLIFLNTGEESDYSLTIIQKELQVKTSGNEINGFRQYLQYWEQNPDKPLILHTDNAIHFGHNVFFDNVKVIVTSYDLLKTHYNLPSFYKESDGTAEQWNRLLKIVSEEQTFEGACCHELLINRYTAHLFETWKRWDVFQRWLLWLWAKSKPTSGYLGLCVSDSINVDDFVMLVYCKIIDFLNTVEYDDYYHERKSLLQKAGISAPSVFWNKLGTLAVNDRLQALTDTSVKEREMVFSILKEIPVQKRSATISILRNVYPALSNYIFAEDKEAIEDFPKSFSEYFFEYRWNKAANILPKSFIETVQSIAVQRGTQVYETKSRNLVVSEEYDDASTIIFVDGMGIEYADYLWNALKPLLSEGFRIRIRAGYCNLPSTTEINKDYLNGRNVAASFLELDEMKHGVNQYPRTIEQELSFLDTLCEKVREAFESGVSRVILSSDHGTSRMAVLVRKTEYDKKVPSEGHSIYKYGRYCEGTDIADKFDTAIEYGDKLIFADYTRFEQKGAPIDEIHGGACLEEWIVPIFIIDNATTRKEKLVVTIVAPMEQLRPDSITNMVTVHFSLEYYSRNDVSVRIHGKKIICRQSGNEYEFKYKPEKTESVISTYVFIGTEQIGNFNFVVKKSIAQNKKFDL